MDMMWLLPLTVGFSIVLQGSVNRRISAEWGLSFALLLNAVILIVAATALFIFVRLKPELFPNFLRYRSGSFSPYYLLPGFLGVVIVAGAPWAISSLGAFRVFVLIVAAQMCGSLLWDLWLEGVSLDTRRVVAAALAMAAAFLAAPRS